MILDISVISSRDCMYFLTISYEDVCEKTGIKILWDVITCPYPW